MTTETDVIEKTRVSEKIDPPKKYVVIIHNDDYTPIDWVIGILMEIFHHSENDAYNLTMQVHNEGSAVAGKYTYEIAEQKAHESMKASRAKGFPLQLTIEAE